MWQVLTRRKRLLRRETGEIALLLGQRALATSGDWSARDPDDERQRLYRCALAAADEFPDEVAGLARRAAERSPAQATGPDAGRRRRRRPSFFPAPSTPVPRWPDGPWTDVDPAFRSAVLEPAVVSELVEARPAIAREIRARDVD